jgi:hypothetical protein
MEQWYSDSYLGLIDVVVTSMMLKAITLWAGKRAMTVV